VDFEAFTDFTTGSLRLMVWYARELVDHREPGVSVHEALDKRVDILRKTTLYDGRHPAMGLDPPNAEWEKLKGHLASILGSRSEDEDTSALEDSCLSSIWPLVKPKLRDAYVRSREFTAGPFGCWRFAYKDEPDPAIDLHFANAFSPESPFTPENRSLVVDSLRDLLDQACRQHPEARSVQCGSWLNRFPPFLTLFPPRWAKTFSEWEYSSGTAGHWGQYMDRRGAFHQRNGEALRRTGCHPYACGPCHCSMREAREHLAQQAAAGLSSD
jgi:hypothetical protein